MNRKWYIFDWFTEYTCTSSCHFFLYIFMPFTHSHTHKHTLILVLLDFILSSAVPMSYQCATLFWLLPLWVKSINDLTQNCNVVHLIFDQPAHLVANVFPIQPIALLVMHELNIVENERKIPNKLTWGRKKGEQRDTTYHVHSHYNFVTQLAPVLMCLPHLQCLHLFCPNQIHTNCRIENLHWNIVRSLFASKKITVPVAIVFLHHPFEKTVYQVPYCISIFDL